MMYGHGTC